MVVFAINSFNTEKYLSYLDNLISKIISLMSTKYTLNKDYHIVCGIGGSKHNNIICDEGVYKLFITKNLSDHNIYTAVDMLHNADQIPHQFHNHTWIMIHDTTWPHELTFVERITRIMERPIPKNWIFAHTLGLYNLGICSLQFILTRAKDWIGVNVLPKEAGIYIETGRVATVDNVRIMPLRMYSQVTLAKIHHEGSLLEDPLEMDFMSLGSVSQSGTSKHYAFIAAFGLYKLTFVDKSFEIPIWSKQCVAKTVYDWKKKMSASETWKSRTAFLPLVHVD